MENEGWGGTKLAEDMCERIIIKPNVATIPNPAYCGKTIIRRE